MCAVTLLDFAQHESAKDMAEKFCDFFVNKIMNIRKDLSKMRKLDNKDSAVEVIIDDSTIWSKFKPVTESGVKKNDSFY